MSTPSTQFSSPFAVEKERTSYGALLGQTMFLVAAALGFTVLGSAMGAGSFLLERNVEVGNGVMAGIGNGAALGCTLGAMGLLLAQSFVAPLRKGPVGMAVLFGAALLIGLGLGPVMGQYLQIQPGAVTKAAGTTALVVVGAGAIGTLTAKDLSPIMKPLSIILLVAVGVSWALAIFGGGGGIAGDLVSLAIGAASAVAIIVYFNYLKMHATEDDVVFLATGIFVGIINIFLSLLNLFSGD